MLVPVHDDRPKPGRLALPSLLGEGMPERLRSTSLGLLGLVTAVGLGCVAFVLQLGLPPVAGGPLPQTPAPAAVADGVPLTDAHGGKGRGPSVPSVPGARGAPPRPTSPDPEAAPPAHDVGQDAPSALGSPPDEARPAPQRRQPGRPRQQQEPPRQKPAPAESPTVVAAPAPVPVEPSASSSEAPPPEPAPEAPAPEASPPEHPGNGNAYGKGNGKGVGNGGVPPGQAKKDAAGTASDG